MIEKDVDDFIAHICAPQETAWAHIIDKLPRHRGYPEAIDNGAELDLLVRYFLPHVHQKPRPHGEWLMHALYNPLNISWLASQLGVACPAGYTEAEMMARNAATDPCPLCGDPVARYSRSFIKCDCLLEDPSRRT
jgi:hypothetical protein